MYFHIAACFLVVAIVATSPALAKRNRREIISHSGPQFLDAFKHKRSVDPNSRVKRQWNLLRYSRPLSQEQAGMIVEQHNDYRRLVNGADMEYMFWDDNLAYQAQEYANTCDFRHSTNRVNTGENIWAATYSNYEGATKMWFDETYYPWCQCRDVFNHCCGHYTQVVWATSNRIGCGFAECSSVIGAGGRPYVLVCQYQPAGNLVGPYEIPAFAYGAPCSRCPSHAPDCFNGLCVPSGYVEYQKKK